MKGKRFRNEKFNVLAWIKVNFMTTFQEEYLHIGDVMNLCRDAVYIACYRIFAGKSQLNSDVCAMTDTCFSE